MSSARIVSFLVITVILMAVSRNSLLHVRSHGFPRFFAWEAIAAQVVLNIDGWFRDPFSLLQILSWIALLISTIYIWEGAYRFLRSGSIDSRRKSPTLFSFEKTTAIVTTGLYRYIRHPMYASLMFLSLGVYFKEPNVEGTILTFSAIGLLVLTALSDERECVEFFGTAYGQYMKGTKRFVPFLL